MLTNNLHKKTMAAGVILFLLSACAIYSYIRWIDDALWAQNISLVRETTYQQAEAVALCFEKEEAEDKSYGKRLQDLNSADTATIKAKLKNWNKGGDVFFVILPDSTAIHPAESYDRNAISAIRENQDYGIVPPHACSSCGHRVIEFYTKIHFADGGIGFLVHEKRIEGFLDGITTDFYNGAGSTYITDAHSTVLLLPAAKQDGLPFVSFFEILQESEGNDKQQLQELQELMQKGETGHVVHYLKGEPQLIYFRPINSLRWYMFSVVPKAELTSGTTAIIRASMLLLSAVLAAMLIMLALLLYRERINLRTAKKEIELHAALQLEKEKNLVAEAANRAQEAQLEEITALNAELQDKQQRLEELSCEQEAQLEEITALNELLEEAKAAAEAASHAKTSFLFNMSHDIRTPMNAIIGFAELLHKHQLDTVKRQDYITKIRESGNVLLSIINNVLEVARIEKGTVQLEEQPKNVHAFVEGVFNMFDSMMAQKNIHFTHSLEHTHHHLICDETKLREVLDNLLSNAYKYTHSGGSVNVEVKELPCDREGYVLMRTIVSDTGIGMSEEYLQRIFEEFSRERTTTECSIQGTGLGMAIVKRFVELMHGTIDIQSRLGEGTTITVTIPHQTVTTGAQQPAHPPKQKIDLHGRRLLLAEDNDLNAEIAEEVLREAGMIVERVADGRECVAVLEAHAANYYSAVLMDIQMPLMNGYEATRHIRAFADKAKAAIPIIAMTANAFAEDKQAAKEAGMNGHVAKPIDVGLLMRQLAHAIEK